MFGRETRMLLRHFLEQGTSKSELARQFGVSRDTIHRWIRDGDLDRDLERDEVRYGPRPPVATKLDRYKGVIQSRLAAFPELSAVRVFDEQDDEHALEAGQFRLEPGRVLLPETIEDMPVLRQRLGIEIDYVAGFGDAADVPADLKQAVLALVAHWFEHRDAAVVAGPGAVVPAGFDRLVETYRQVRL